MGAEDFLEFGLFNCCRINFFRIELRIHRTDGLRDGRGSVQWLIRLGPGGQIGLAYAATHTSGFVGSRVSHEVLNIK